MKRPKNKQKIRLDGFAEADGITFSVHTNTSAEYRFSYGHTAYFTEQGEIKTKVFYGNINNARIDSKINYLTEKVYKPLVYTVFALMIINIALVFMNVNPYIRSITYSALVFIAGLTCFGEAIAILTAKIKGNQEIISFLKLQTAMNRTRNAYYNLQDIPVGIYEVKKFSPISSESKYLKMNFFISFIWFIITMHMASDLKQMLICFIILTICILCERTGKVCFWQYLIYTEPDNEHYELALVALEETILKGIPIYSDMYSYPITTIPKSRIHEDLQRKMLK